MASDIETVVTPRAAFQHRDFRLFQLGRALSIVGTEMQSVAVGWQVFEITHQPIDLGYVGLAQFLPAVLLSIPAGHTADRFDRRAVLMTCYLSYALCSLLLFLQAYRGGRSVLPIFIVLVLIGFNRAFSGPASQSLVPQLVPQEHFGNAVAWAASVFQISTILGPALGGLIYGWARGAAPVYATAASFYAAGFIFLLMMHVRTGRMEKKDVSLETLLAGVRYVWQEKIILGSISLDLFAVLLGGAVALLPVYAQDILHIGPRGLGVLRSMPAAGAAVMAVVLAYRPLRRRSGALMFIAVAIFGISTIVFGLSRSIPLSLIALFVVGASDMISVVVRSTLVQIATPPAMRGRVSAVNLLFIGASNELGQFESGITAQWFGAVPAVILGGIGTLVVVGLWARIFPQLRNMDRLIPISEAPIPEASKQQELA
ncbi:MAG TPA: MFS transporter [Terriglobales bacterium]|nr:MFS transporter [Terriglobales bacterium]